MAGKKNSKIEVLKMIRDTKEVLFGAFSEKLSKPEKHEKWLEVHNLARALGLVPNGKDFKYTRDTFWQNIRKNTMKKIDNRTQTGSAGGVECKLTEVDNIVLDIIGRESPVIIGLPVKETWDDSPATQPLTQPPSLSTSEFPPESELEPALTEVEPTPSRNVKKRKEAPDDDVEALKKKKLMLTIEIMEKENYLKSLQILKLERELGVPPSRFTSDIDTSAIYVIEDSDVTNVQN